MAGYDKIVAHEFGGPEVLRLEHSDVLPEPGPGEARVRVEAAGVGYTDTIVRRGRYIDYRDGLPCTPGYDLVGIVDAVGSGVVAVRVGDRVADMPVAGAYSQFVVRPAGDLVPVPAGVAPDAAVEVPLMWMTAWQMLTRAAAVSPGTIVLVVGASGGVGRALVLLGRHLGLRIVGTCSAANLAQVTALGATAIDYRGPDLPAALRTASGGAGFAAAFDAIGAASWETSWQTLAAGGILIGYGHQDFLETGAPSSVAVESMRNITQDWNAMGASDGTHRRTAFYNISTQRVAQPDEYRQDAAHLLALIASGAVVPRQAEIWPLGRAAEAHRRIAAGGLHARIVLRP